jgi:hypothetical protein
MFHLATDTGRIFFVGIAGMFAATNVLEYEKPSLFEQLPGARKRLLGFDPHSLEELGRLDLIRIIEVIRPGRRRPIKLVHIPSLIAYIERVEELARNKRLAEIRAGYAHHYASSHEGQSFESGQAGKISFLEIVPQPEVRP